MVTAPRQYATKLTTKLMAAGARPLWLPTIQIAELRDSKDQQVGNRIMLLGKVFLFPCICLLMVSGGLLGDGRLGVI